MSIVTATSCRVARWQVGWLEKNAKAKTNRIILKLADGYQAQGSYVFILMDMCLYTLAQIRHFTVA